MRVLKVGKLEELVKEDVAAGSSKDLDSSVVVDDSVVQ
jgi:hypothetical protein